MRTLQQIRLLRRQVSLVICGRIQCRRRRAWQNEMLADGIRVLGNHALKITTRSSFGTMRGATALHQLVLDFMQCPWDKCRRSLRVYRLRSLADWIAERTLARRTSNACRHASACWNAPWREQQLHQPHSRHSTCLRTLIIAPCRARVSTRFHYAECLLQPRCLEALKRPQLWELHVLNRWRRLKTLWCNPCRPPPSLRYSLRVVGLSVPSQCLLRSGGTSLGTASAISVLRAALVPVSLLVSLRRLAHEGCHRTRGCVAVSLRLSRECEW